MPDGSSFLYEISKRKLLGINEFAPFFDVLKWLFNLVIIFPQTKLRNIEQFFASDSKSSIENLLKYFDTGIESVSGARKTIDETLEFLPDEIRSDLSHTCNKQQEL